MATTLQFAMVFLISLNTCAGGNRNVRLLQVEPGEEITVLCSTTRQDQEGLYLHHVYQDKKDDVLFLNKNPAKLTINSKFKQRVETAGHLEHYTIMIHNLTESDSGIYCCVYNKLNEDNMETHLGDGEYMVYVTDTATPAIPTNSSVAPRITMKMDGKNGGTEESPFLVMVSALTAGSVFLLCVIILIIWAAPRVKRRCKRRGGFYPSPQETIYEDMCRNRCSS